MERRPYRALLMLLLETLFILACTQQGCTAEKAPNTASAPSSISADVTVNVNYVAQNITPHFVGAGEEMWQFLDAVDVFGSSYFQKVAMPLKPLTLRVGGITADWVDYMINGTLPSAGTDMRRRFRDHHRLGGFWPSYERNITESDFDSLLQFVQATDTRLLFDLNELHGRNCHVYNTTHCEGDWNTTNVQSFLTALKSRRLGPIYGFELGNELTRSDHISMDTNIADHKRMAKIIQDVWPDASTRPPLFGPSTDICDDTARQFMQELKGIVAGFTYHSYPGANGDTLNTSLLDPHWLRNNILETDVHANSSICISLWKNISRPAGMRLWLTETSSSYNGVEGILDTFLNGFWYIASLGQYAKTGVEVHARWSFVGGHGAFSLFDEEMQPRPDYFIAVLHKSLIGGGAALNATSSDDSVLVYGHCSNQGNGNVVLLFANPLQQTTTLHVTAGSISPSSIKHDDYVITAPFPMSNQTILNRKTPLKLNKDGSLPPLDPVSATGPIVLPPVSHGFVVLSNTDASLCKV